MSKYSVDRQQLKLGTDRSECIGGGEEREGGRGRGVGRGGEGRGEEGKGRGVRREKVTSNWTQLLGVEKCC